MHKKTQEQEVLKALDKSDELHAEIFGTKEKDSSEQSTEQPKEQPEKVVKPKPVKKVEVSKQEKDVEKVIEKVDKTDKVEKPVQESITQSIEPVEKPKPEKVDTQDADFKAKFDVLSGKYNAEISRYKAQVKDENDEIRKLKDTIVSLEQRELPKPQEQPVAVTEMPVAKSADTEVSSFDIETTKYLKPEDKEDYGEGMLDFVIRGANEVVELKLKDYHDKLTNYINGRIRQVEQKLAPIENIQKELSTVQTVQHETVEDKFYSDLGGLSPDWVKIKDNAHSNGFQEWLDKPSPESGFLRKDLLTDAFKYFDANRVAMLYNAYTNTHTQSPESNARNDEILNEPTITDQPITQPIVQPVAESVVEPTIVNPNTPSVDDLIQPSKTKAREDEVFPTEVPPNIGDATARIAKAGEDLRMRKIDVDQYNQILEGAIGEGAFYKNGRLVK